MRFTTFLLTLILLGAGCLSNTIVESTQTVEPEVTITPPVTEETIETTAYAMSGSQLRLSIPSDWTIYQQDGGTASSIVIKPTDDQQTMYVGIERAQTFEGDKISYDDWLDGKNWSIVSSTTDVVDGQTFNSYEVTGDGDWGVSYTRRILAAEIEGKDVNWFVTITTHEDIHADYQSIIDSIIFNPTEEELLTVEIIH